MIVRWISLWAVTNYKLWIMNTLGLTPNLYQKRNPYLYEYFSTTFRSFSLIKRIITFFHSKKKKRKCFNWYFKFNLPQIVRIQGTWTRLWLFKYHLNPSRPWKEHLIFKTIMHNTRRICYYQTEIITTATNPLPRIFVAFRRNDSGPDERKMAASVPHSDISLAPSTPRRATFVNAFMRECAFAVRFPPFYFILFYFFGWDEHLFTGHARVEHESSRGCFPPMIVIPFDTALNTNLTANWNTRNERAQKWHRDPLSFVFQRAYTAFSMIDTRVSCGRFGSRMFFVLWRDYVKYLMRFLLISWLWLQFAKKKWSGIKESWIIFEEEF